MNGCHTCTHFAECNIPDPVFCHSWEPNEEEKKRMLERWDAAHKAKEAAQ